MKTISSANVLKALQASNVIPDFVSHKTESVWLIMYHDDYGAFLLLCSHIDY